MAAISTEQTNSTFWGGVVSLKPLKKHFEWWLKGMAICAIPMVVICTIVIAIELTTPSAFTAGIGKIISYCAEDLLNVAVEASMFGCIILAKDARKEGDTRQYKKMRTIGWGFASLTIITVSFKLFGASAAMNEGLLIVRDAAVICYVYVAHMDDDGEDPSLSPIQVAGLEQQMQEQVAQISATGSQLVADVQRSISGQVAHEVAQISASVRSIVADEVAQNLATLHDSVAHEVAQISSAPSAAESELSEQVRQLVGLVNDQARIIEHFTNELAGMRREVRTTITEIRSTAQELPALPHLASVSVDASSEPGDRVKAFLGAWSSPKRPTIQAIMDACQVAKKTATRYRDEFYGLATDSQIDDGE